VENLLDKKNPENPKGYIVLKDGQQKKPKAKKDKRKKGEKRDGTNPQEEATQSQPEIQQEIALQETEGDQQVPDSLEQSEVTPLPNTAMILCETVACNTNSQADMKNFFHFYRTSIGLKRFWNLKRLTRQWTNFTPRLNPKKLTNKEHHRHTK
jgi:hypothetical protein